MCGIPWDQAMHVMPASLANQILACHWLDLGLELESPNATTSEDVKTRLNELSKRAKSWQFLLPSD